MIGSDVGRVVERTNKLKDAARAEAFAGLVDRRALDHAYRFATLMLGDRGDAEDATHDAALTAWRRFGDLRERDRFEAWFGRILHNVCRDRLRARRRTPLSLDLSRRPQRRRHGSPHPTRPRRSFAATPWARRSERSRRSIARS